jgi:GNAT superfamily N-acetyltransferase
MTHGSRRIELIDRPDPKVVARLGDEITAFNFATTGVHDGQEFYGAVHDDQGTLVAGVYGWTWGGTGWIERLWVRESSRGQGLGTGLLAAVESEAQARGCTQLALTTHSFQAPDFYGRHGFEIAGEVPQYPAGHSYFLMLRRLS